MADMIWPTVCKTISQGYGVKNSRYVKGYHTGLDIACINGSPIRAAHDGQVTGAGNAGAYGNQVKIKKGDIETWYNHLSVIRVHVGENVSQGTVIGLEGTTGNSTGPHLHFEVRKNGQDVDPMPYLKGSAIITASDPATQASSVFSFPGQVVKVFEWLTEPTNWLRIGMVIGGAVMLIMALVGLAKTKALGKNVTKVVKNAVPGRTRAE